MMLTWSVVLTDHRILALGMLLFETKTEAFTRFVAEKFGFMFFPLGRFCFSFLYVCLYCGQLRWMA